MEASHSGLTTTEAHRRFNEAGPNAVAVPPFNFIKAILSRLWEPSAWILEGALIIEILLGKGLQAGFIILMLLFAAINGAIQARRSARVLRTLTTQLIPLVAVKRDQAWQKLPATQIVVDDLISLKQGDLVAADGQLVTGTLAVDESSITGESVTIQHQIGDQIYAGTEILQGHALAYVTRTGSNSRAGKTISLMNTATAPGQLQRLLGKIIGYLAILDTVLAVVLVVTAIIRHEDLISLLPFLAMLFIATIPIAMPSSFAVANAVEANVLSKQHVLVSDLAGIQAAANLNLLLIDKTGTITKNQPQVIAWHNLSTWSTPELLSWAASATDQRDPSVLDTAITTYATKQHAAPTLPTHFEPFNATRGYAESMLALSDGTTVNIKLGAYRRLSQLNRQPLTLPAKIDFQQGRTVAMLVNDCLAGIFVVQDQPRSDSAAKLKAIKQRGVKVIMLTGDHQQTARAIAQQVNLAGKVVSFTDFETHPWSTNDLAGIAEVVPENKLAIVKHFQKAGYTVGMTGDGVNDAPALKQAEVGIAMQNAVDLAKHAAKIVLLTPGLTSLTNILDSGHRVYQRMLTWTITKLSRTAELTLLLTIGYLASRFIPLTLNAMVLVAILNDLVTLVLGTDRTTITYQPENWNLKRLGLPAGVLAVSWTLVGIGGLWWLTTKGYPTNTISTWLYCYLIFSAMLTILMTRTQQKFWQSRPSKMVGLAVTGNLVLTVLLACYGWGIAPISPLMILLTFLLTLITAIVLSLLKH
ncbi:HAD-IC family P-type ATPase [Lactiplantibacillus fabifermentans]|uniref:E1-E2 family cation-transport ATPase n=2 Tax=Lactiplantibacillus fabifermentans TaxID=483011 RepID=A0A0R2NJQ0_9LACO|nr:HAD-IC family P-type ATPase [Lactiplantibacillus fabifermentans]ETY75291.1 cation-transporting ATPase [Lactiplantibacillus fabifermentans T30PCM01]KRO26006.1 E1-E2 family cation-transport ATPase [Lactiplantibacillus fabifermentans DSM 21115]